MLHIPILRGGTQYRSLQTFPLTDFRTGETLAEVSQANPGLIAKDLQSIGDNQAVLAEIPIADLIDMSVAAADHFMNSTLPLGEATQSPQQYLDCLTATTGMPKVMARANMGKIATALEKTAEVLRGLTRGADLENLRMDFRRETNALGAILPNNSPGVHSLWLPAIAMQVPVVLKPGSREPWSPYRIIQAFMQAGVPGEAFGYYPTDPNGTREILMRTGRSMFFGDSRTVEAWKSENKIQLHGTGYSKVILGEDKADDWRRYLDLMVKSISINGGRSCINASGVWVAGHGREIAEALAQEMAKIEPLGMDDPNAKLSAFTNPKQAEMISRSIDSQLVAGGAEDLTAKYRGDERLVEVDGCTFLRPTIVWCNEPTHALAQAEYLFPFAAVVEVPHAQLPDKIGFTLVASVISDEPTLVDRLFASSAIDRLNVGPMATNSIRWDQPHEGNLFELLYKQRAVQVTAF